MKKLTVVSAAVLMGLALSACSSDKPQRAPNMNTAQKDFKRGGLSHDLKELNLTDAQKAQIKQIMEQNRPLHDGHAAPNRVQREQFHSQMEVRRMAENRLITDTAFDETAARNLIAQRDQMQNDRQQRQNEVELQRLKIRHDIMQVLTLEQRQQWLAAQQQRQNSHPDGRHTAQKRSALMR